MVNGFNQEYLKTGTGTVNPSTLDREHSKNF